MVSFMRPLLTKEAFKIHKEKVTTRKTLKESPILVIADLSVQLSLKQEQGGRSASAIVTRPPR